MTAYDAQPDAKKDGACSNYVVGMLLVFVYGVVFGWARLRTESLRAPIALHMIVNGTVCAYALLKP